MRPAKYTATAQGLHNLRWRSGLEEQWLVVVLHLALGEVAVLGALVEQPGGDALVTIHVAVADTERLVRLDLEHSDRVPDEPREPPAVPPARLGHRGVTLDRVACVHLDAMERFPHVDTPCEGSDTPPLCRQSDA